jgi:hypothetical protein
MSDYDDVVSDFFDSLNKRKVTKSDNSYRDRKYENVHVVRSQEFCTF